MKGFSIIGDTLVCKIHQFHSSSGLELVNKDPRKQDIKPDCYSGVVVETGDKCKLTKVGDEITFIRWEYSQWESDDEHTVLREVDLVVVNDKCVNGYCAVKLYEPVKKTEELIFVESRHEVPKNYWGQIIHIDHSRTNDDTRDLREGDIILFQRMDDYQYRVGKHTVIFRNDYDVVMVKMEQEVELHVA